MKKLIFLIPILMIFIQINAQSQDLIFLKRDTINAKIIEIGRENLVYQEADMPVKVINKNNVLRIEYKNGIIEDFGSLNPRKINPYNIGLVFSKHVVEYEMIKVDAEFNYFIKPYYTLSFNAGIDINKSLYFSVGPRFYYNNIQSKEKFTPFIGFQIGRINFYTFTDYSSYTILYESPSFTVELPVGFEYITNGGFNFGARLNPLFINKSREAYLLFSIKFGRSF